ncbi:MAG: monovalent cation/H+ antiporter complex subunit F [Candidatus Promineifilaceae bacterium]|nr:monovalent cation/H+ antiporter complex subunit F [Candidatus Promineifilaceae bacterium]
MLTTALTYTLYVALAIYAGLISYAVWRVWRGENGVDRLIGVELIGTLMLGVFILIALIEGNGIFLDVALGLAALGFIGVVALAKYAADRRLY